MSGKAASEAELLRASLAGSREAFGAIVEKYQGLVCGITYSATGNRPISEELAQETFIRAWNRLRQLRNQGRFRAWLCTIARNAARKSMTKQGRDAADGAEPIEDLQQIESPEPGPVEHAISNEQQAVVWAALREIPETYREPLVLFYRQQRSVRQVAAELELSQDVVKQRLSRGRKLLKAELASVVEDVIEKTRPGKVFTVAVIAALPAVTAEAATAAVAAAAAKTAGAAKAAGAFSLLGATLGPLLGLLGSIIGIRASIINTKSPRERAFMKRRGLFAIFYCYGGMALILVLWWKIRWVMANVWGLVVLLTVYLIGVLIFAFTTEKRRKAIQMEQGTYVEPARRMMERSKGQIYGAFAGAIFGSLSLLWLHITAGRAGDWVTLCMVLVCGILIFLIAARSCLRWKQHISRIAAGSFAAVGLLHFIVMNMRWGKWIAHFRQGGRPLPYPRVSRWQINAVIAAVVAILMLIFLFGELKRRRLSNKEQQKQAD
jgi:RNA polymerase sigma factor (sigma-70 family)